MQKPSGLLSTNELTFGNLNLATYLKLRQYPQVWTLNVSSQPDKVLLLSYIDNRYQENACTTFVTEIPKVILSQASLLWIWNMIWSTYTIRKLPSLKD